MAITGSLKFGGKQVFCCEAGRLAALSTPRPQTLKKIMELNKYQRALELGRDNMNIHHYGSKEYILAEKLVAWACEQTRKENKVQLSVKSQNNGKNITRQAI